MREATARRRTASPMRIVLAAEPTSGGVIRHVLDLAEGLPRRGFQVLLVHSRREVAPGFRERLARSRDFGYETATFDVARAPGRKDLAAAIELRDAIRRFGGADVLHGHSSKAGALARLARWSRARRVVYTPHAWYTQNPELSAMTRGTYRVIERALAAVTDRIVSVSRDEVEHAVTIGIGRRKLVLIENGIESWTPDRIAAARARTRSQLGIAPHEIVVGFLGRLAPQKAPETALRAYQHLLAAQPEARFVFAGEGPESARVDALIAELGLTERVIRIPVAHGPDVIPAFDVFLMTSRYEGFPYVLLEALAAGCAIVTTRVGGVTDCVLDGVNGFVVDSSDPDAIARRVMDVMASPDVLARMRAESLARASSFTIDRMLDRTADLYRSLHEAS